MKDLARFLFTVGCIASSAVLLFPVPAYADGVTFTGPTSVTLIENGTTQTLTYTLTNKSGADLTGVFSSFAITVASPDQSDTLFGTNTFCPSTLANGASCTDVFSFTLDGTGETDADSGTQVLTYQTTWDGSPAPLRVATTVTVVDPGVPVPEPSSLLLLASGLAGTATLRKRSRPTSM